jgi:methionine-rich copper-binding protein CopC
VPRVVAFHETWAGKLEELERARPHVVSIEPRSGASDVDPAAAQLVVRFDRAMRDQSWSIVGSKENTPAMTGAPKYDAERKTLTVPMQLEPGKTYRFSLNGVSKEGFKSAEGVPLEPYEVTFTTRG